MEEEPTEAWSLSIDGETVEVPDAEIDRHLEQRQLENRHDRTLGVDLQRMQHQATRTRVKHPDPNDLRGGR